MDTVPVAAFKWGVKIGYAFLVVSFFVVFIGLAVSAVGVLLNESITEDVLYLIQMWLPFNITPMFSWLFVATTAYFAYRLAATGYNIIHNALQ